jgi:hypothetical protein
VKRQASHLLRLVGAVSACATLSLALYLPTSAQTWPGATVSSTLPSKTPMTMADSDSGSPMISQVAGQSRSREDMELLFTVKLHGRSDKIEDAVVPAADREGVYISSAAGTVEGKRLSGRMRTSMFSGNCPVPGMRKGEGPPKGLHLCTVNPGGIIETQDGARIRFDGKGYGLFSPQKYRVSMTMAFATDDSRYQWLTPLLGAMEGEVDLKAGAATWNVYLPRS